VLGERAAAGLEAPGARPARPPRRGRCSGGWRAWPTAVGSGAVGDGAPAGALGAALGVTLRFASSVKRH